MKLIVAVNNQGFIGKDGQMMWRSREDFKHFKKMTIGKFGQTSDENQHLNNLIVGRKTFETCLGGRGLLGRDLLIVGSGLGQYTLADAVRVALNDEKKGTGEAWVIGGGLIYNALIHLCSEIHISHINNDDVGDTKFTTPPHYRGEVINYYFEPDTLLTLEERMVKAVEMGLLTKTKGDVEKDIRSAYLTDHDKYMESGVMGVEAYMDFYKVPTYKVPKY